MGNILINSPGTPGQNNIGKNAHNVVAVEETMGQNILLAAEPYASIGPVPSAMRLSAYSTTTMAPSTNIPTASINPNITILEIVIPDIPISAKAKRKEVGIAKPTRRADRIPSAAKTTIITRAMAVKTDPSSWLTISETCLD